MNRKLYFAIGSLDRFGDTIMDLRGTVSENELLRWYNGEIKVPNSFSIDRVFYVQGETPEEKAINVWLQRFFTTQQARKANPKGWPLAEGSPHGEYFFDLSDDDEWPFLAAWPSEEANLPGEKVAQKVMAMADEHYARKQAQSA